MPADYVAIITDGNGRWAQQRGLPVIDGHQAGADCVKARLRDAAEFGVKELTVYSFSTENWTRRASGCESAGGVRGSPRSSPAAWTGRRRKPTPTTASPCSAPSTTEGGR